MKSNTAVPRPRRAADRRGASKASRSATVCASRSPMGRRRNGGSSVIVAAEQEPWWCSSDADDRHGQAPGCVS